MVQVYCYGGINVMFSLLCIVWESNVSSKGLSQAQCYKIISIFWPFSEVHSKHFKKPCRDLFLLFWLNRYNTADCSTSFYEFDVNVSSHLALQTYMSDMYELLLSIGKETCWHLHGRPFSHTQICHNRKLDEAILVLNLLAFCSP